VGSGRLRVVVCNTVLQLVLAPEQLVLAPEQLCL